MKSTLLSIPLGSDLSDKDLILQGTSYDCGNEGPKVLLTGVLHGDEITAGAALWYVAESLANTSFAGTVTVFPCVNILAARESSRLIPRELSDLNRCFPGRPDGSLGERLAAALVNQLKEHDLLIDVHTAGWCVPFVLLDSITDRNLARRVAHWADAAGLPVVGEMEPELAELQGLDRSWSAYAIAQSKPAITMELTGFHTLDHACARRGSKAIRKLLEAHSRLTEVPLTDSSRHVRLEHFGNSAGFFEAFHVPGESVDEKQELGVIRSSQGAVKERVYAARRGAILAMQPLSPVNPGSWLSTLAVTR